MAEVDADRLELLDHDHDPTHQTEPLNSFYI